MENDGEKKFPKLLELLTIEEKKKSNNITKITDKIYIGDEDGAKELDYLKAEQIHYILSIVPTPPTYPEEMNINIMHLNIEDGLNIQIIQHLKNCIEFIEKSDKIYIHCICGVNRSPAIAIGYLMWKTHSSYDDVFNYIKQKRDCIELNNLFIIQLKKFQNLLKSCNYDLQKIEVKPKDKNKNL